MLASVYYTYMMVKDEEEKMNQDTEQWERNFKRQIEMRMSVNNDLFDKNSRLSTDDD